MLLCRCSATESGTIEIIEYKKGDMHMQRFLTAFFLFLILLTACGTTTSAYPYPDPSAFQYIGRKYVLITLYADPVLPENAPYIFFNGSDLNGKAYCNLYSGPYTGDGAALKPGAIAMTEMACADPTLMLLDSTYFAALNEVTSMSLDGTTLTLSNAAGTTVLVYNEE
jgi:heat shock protein HslJ